MQLSLTLPHATRPLGGSYVRSIDSLSTTGAATVAVLLECLKTLRRSNLRISTPETVWSCYYWTTIVQPFDLLPVKLSTWSREQNKLLSQHRLLSSKSLCTTAFPSAPAPPLRPHLYLRSKIEGQQQRQSCTLSTQYQYWSDSLLLRLTGREVCIEPDARCRIQEKYCVPFTSLRGRMLIQA